MQLTYVPSPARRISLWALLDVAPPEYHTPPKKKQTRQMKEHRVSSKAQSQQCGKPVHHSKYALTSLFPSILAIGGAKMASVPKELGGWGGGGNL